MAYRTVRPSDPKWKRARKSYGPSVDLLLAKINRLDMRRLNRRATLVAPARPVSVLECSPFPRFLPEVTGWPKLVLVSLRVQAFGAYENGQLVQWGPTSTGVRKKPTPASLYFTGAKSRRKISTLNGTWIMPWYVNLHTSMGVAFHQYAMPGRPFSHGCIRLLKDDAIWMYRWADDWVPSEDRITARVFGTPVIVFGEYDYAGKPPWQLLPENPAATEVSVEELAPFVEKYRMVIDQRVRSREQHLQHSSEVSAVN
ncbi:MAG: L,D-transpeptidase [Acidobacteriota bacterium]